MIDPNFTYDPVTGDKAGKDNNYRGLTQYDGNLYFTKGSGSNGIDTVYTVSNPNGALPTSATAISATDLGPAGAFQPTHAKRPGPNYTPFGLFFANPTTLYVADEGTGRRDRRQQTRRAGKMDAVEWDLVARLYVAGGPDRRHL